MELQHRALSSKEVWQSKSWTKAQTTALCTVDGWDFSKRCVLCVCSTHLIPLQDHRILKGLWKFSICFMAFSRHILTSSFQTGLLKTCTISSENGNLQMLVCGVCWLNTWLPRAQYNEIRQMWHMGDTQVGCDPFLFVYVLFSHHMLVRSVVVGIRKNDGYRRFYIMLFLGTSASAHTGEALAQWYLQHIRDFCSLYDTSTNKAEHRAPRFHKQLRDWLTASLWLKL